MIALVDCNNFFVSCERLFTPALHGRATVVLSSNDGCVVSRSAEAKALGIPMGEAAHVVEREFAGRVAMLSANFALYADISRRVMRVLADLAPVVETHSVDEAFLPCAGLADPAGLAATWRATILRWCGIPVSVGLAPTRTLAKLANDHAKRAADGVAAFAMPGDALLAATPTAGVWGIGAQRAAQLATLGIRDARALRDADPAALRQALGVGVERTARELAGEPCLAAHEADEAQRSLMVSRSFGTPSRDPAVVAHAVATFAARAGERLRHSGLTASSLGVWLVLGPSHAERRSISATTALSPPTSHSPELIAAARRLAAGLLPDGALCRKAGVWCAPLIPAADGVQDDWRDQRDHQRDRRVMAALDRLNARHGAGTLGFAAAMAAKATWHPLAARRSPAWTTDWNALRRVG